MELGSEVPSRSVGARSSYLSFLYRTIKWAHALQRVVAPRLVRSLLIRLTLLSELLNPVKL